MGAAVFGALLGPVVGAIATVAGVTATFAGIGVLGVGLAAWVAATPGVPAQPQAMSELFRRADRRLAGGMWLLLLPALLFGVVAVLVPLRLHDGGWGGVAIGAVFLVTAGIETLLNPLLGRFTDRRGRLLPIRVALVASAVVSVCFAVATSPPMVAALVVAAGLTYGAFYTPGMSLLTDAAERRGIAAGLAFGAMNGAWAAGNVVGPAAGGWLAELGGDALPYLLLAVACVATFALTVWRPALPPTKVAAE
jgi:MFS family permease